jgi:beta-N-acetylhexosaminidase
MRIALVALLSLLLLSCATTDVPPVERAAAPAAPPPPAAAPVRDRMHWVDSVIATMSLDEKVAQMFMVGTFGHYFSTQSDEYERLVRLVQERKIGGFILWQGDVYEAAVRLNRLQRLSKVPLLVSADFEKGLAMRVRRGTYFPDAMAIGATGKPHYAFEIGKAIAEESRAIGVHQNYAPVADINTNPANPVINTRSFGEDPGLVTAMVTAFVKGTQAGGAIATVKHFPGHGDTGVDSHLDLPVVRFNRARFDSVELSPFRAAIDSGARSIMIAHIAAPALDSTGVLPSSLSRNTVQGVLQTDLAFDGLVVTDAMDMRGVVRDFSVGRSTILAVKAGVDMVLMPPDEDAALLALANAVRVGDIRLERIEHSVRKILLIKQQLGLDTLRVVDIDKVADHVATRDHLALARDVARDAITVLRNDGMILPLETNDRKRLLSVVMSDAEEYRTDVNRPGSARTSEQVGSYFNTLVQRRNGRLESIRLSPSSENADFDAALEKMKHAELVVMPVFARVRSASGRIGLPQKLTAFMERAGKIKAPLIVISFGSPYAVRSIPQANVLMCAYGDGEPMIEATVETLFGEVGACGRLPITVPGLYARGTGMVCTQARLRRDDPFAVGIAPDRLVRVEEILQNAIRDSAFPAAQIAIAKGGVLVLNKAFGRYSYDADARDIDNTTLFDLASVSKVIGTTSAVMKLVEENRLSLEDPLGKYLPQAAQGRKAAITIRHLLLHRAGFPPFKRFFLMCRSKEEALDSIYATELVAAPGDTTIYSDIGMITLGKVIEKIAGEPLDRYLQQVFFKPLGMSNTLYNPPASLIERVAPTEVDSLWRMKLIRGEVHDENADLLGGVAGHAGLFSTASDLAIYMQMLLNGGTYGGVRYLQERTIAGFTRTVVPGQERFLGWDMKSPTGSSAGTNFSLSSFGHTGFTGTSIWADPERDLFVVLLTNRVYPTRANLKIAKVRPAVHDAVIKAIIGEERPQIR